MTESNKICSKCGELKPLSEFYKHPTIENAFRGQCKKCMYDYYEKYRLETGKQSDLFKKCYYENVRRYQDVNHARKTRKRLRVLKHYGGDPPKCVCCGETIVDFLTIDHIDGDGAEKRRNGQRGQIANWIIKHNFPEGFQVLCYNCNWGKYINGGTCPHKIIEAYIKEMKT